MQHILENDQRKVLSFTLKSISVVLMDFTQTLKKNSQKYGKTGP
jgi:hypothetical protein